MLGFTFLAGFGCASAPEPPTAAREIECPAGPGSMAPNLALGPNGTLYLSWIEPAAAGHELRFATLEDGHWSKPQTIATGREWFVNWADFPAMAALADGTLAAHWLVKSAEDTYAYDIHVALSRDGGRGWSDPFVLHDDGTRTEHGFVSLVADNDGFRVVWLDGRETAQGGAMTLRSAIVDRNGSVQGDALIDDKVCDCCQTDAVVTEDGSVVVVYRDRTDSEIRDISSARFAGIRWSSPQTVHDDGWLMPACPVNGPAVAAIGGSLGCAWFTSDRDRQGRVQLAFSDDAGDTFGPPVRVDEGDPRGRVDLLMTEDGAALVVWLERADVLVRRVDRTGRLGPAITVTTGAEGRASGFPRIARTGDRVVIAWTQPGDPSFVRTAELPLDQFSH